MRGFRSLLMLFAFGLLLVGYVVSGCDSTTPHLQQLAPADPNNGEYLFCFWNVENLFDDRNDNRSGEGDKEYDPWYANRPDILQLKLAKLTEALLTLNGGRGPDILAICEVESIRAAELLQNALNTKLADPSLHYRHVLMKEVSVGRHIAPAIITRVPAVKDRTRSLDKRLRIVEGHLTVAGHELIVLASHWTSRLREASEKGRKDYADKLYGAANAMYKSNPGADFLICGDFNDTPADVSLTDHLRADADLNTVPGGPLRLYNLMAGKDSNAGYGTHYYSRWFTFDQIVVSPGMVDAAGWSCDPASVQAIQSLSKPGDVKHRPWRFGSERDQGPRGYSDHFPVAVKLRVQQ